MTRACGDMNADYVKRPISINKIYKDDIDDCHYYDDDN